MYSINIIIQNTDIRTWYKTNNFNMELFHNVDTETVNTEVNTV